MIIKTGVLFEVVAFSLLIAGCSTPREPPTNHISNAELAVAIAQEKAQQVASEELLNADDNLKKANEAIKGEHYEQAEWFATRAILDAKLAEAKFEAENAKKATKILRDSINSIREEVNRVNK